MYNCLGKKAEQEGRQGEDRGGHGRMDGRGQYGRVREKRRGLKCLLSMEASMISSVGPEQIIQVFVFSNAPLTSCHVEALTPSPGLL